MKEIKCPKHESIIGCIEEIEGKPIDKIMEEIEERDRKEEAEERDRMYEDIFAGEEGAKELIAYHKRMDLVKKKKLEKA